jgi:hypothetical protein
MSSGSNDSVWTVDIEKLLENIRFNCVILSKAHKERYFYLKSWLKYFKIPSIILSAINSVIAIGLNTYLEQTVVSLINCLISLVIGILNSIELYIGVEKELAIELSVSKDYYLLSVSIYKILNLDRDNRNIDGSAFLDQCLSTYSKLFESSCVLQRRLLDKLSLIEDTKFDSKTESKDELNNELHEGEISFI